MPVSIITFACGGLEKIWKAQEASKIYISNFVCEENVLPTYTYTTLQNFKKLQRIQIQLGRYVRLRTNNLEKLSRFQKLPAYSELNIQSCCVFFCRFEKTKKTYFSLFPILQSRLEYQTLPYLRNNRYIIGINSYIGSAILEKPLSVSVITNVLYIDLDHT